MGRLKHLLEHGGVKVLTPQDVLLTRLLDLDNDGDDEEEEDDATGDTDYGSICIVQVVQDVGFPLLCKLERKHSKKKKKHVREYTDTDLQKVFDNF